MTAQRQQAMAGISQQITQAQYAVVPAVGSGNTGVAGVRGQPTRVVGGAPTVQPGQATVATRVEPATQRLPPVPPNPYIQPGALGIPPPPPPTTTSDKEPSAQRRAISAYRQAAIGLRIAQQNLRTRASLSNRWLGGIATPGGIWVPFWILLFIFLVLIPVKNHTRLRWLWMVMTGHALLAVTASIEQQGSSIGGGIIGGIGAALGLSSTTTTTPSNTGTTGIVDLGSFSDYYMLNSSNYLITVNNQDLHS